MKLTELYTAVEILRAIIDSRIKEFKDPSLEIDFNGLASLIDNLAISPTYHLKDVTFYESVIICLSLVPHIDPDFFSKILSDHFPDGNDFQSFGGVRGNHHRGILPTGETAQFILAGNDLEKRLEI